MDKTLYDLSFIPDEAKDPELWNMLRGDKFKAVLNLLILNEIRRYNPETLNDAQCRTQLAKLNAYLNAIDFTVSRCRGEEEELIETEIN